MNPLKEHEDRIDELTNRLRDIGAKWAWDIYGKRTTICFITEKDGWEMVGISYTQDPANFNATIGQRWALEDAVQKLGQGRFFQGNELGK